MKTITIGIAPQEKIRERMVDIPETVRSYIDYERFARDCEPGRDMAEFKYHGDTWTCTNAA